MIKKFFENKWTKRVFSIASAFYCAGVFWLCYFALFFDMEIKSKGNLCVLITGISLIFLVVMLYTRKQIITRLSSLLLIPALLPVILYYFGEWSMIIPIAATSLIIFLLSGVGEGMKTAFGTGYLLLYIFGSLGYFLINSMFVTVTNSETVRASISPSGNYRCYIVNIHDTSSGSTTVYVEPNNADRDYKFATFRIRNFERACYVERPMIEGDITLEWKQQARSEITAYLKSISDTIVIHLSESQLGMLGYTYNSKLVLTDLEPIDFKNLGRQKGETVTLESLSNAQLAQFKFGRTAEGEYYILNPAPELVNEMKAEPGEKIYIKDISSKWKDKYFVAKDDTVMLSSLSELQLDMLGVPAIGDVLYFNGQPCFRYYVAVLENYFDTDHKKLALF